MLVPPWSRCQLVFFGEGFFFDFESSIKKSHVGVVFVYDYWEDESSASSSPSNCVDLRFPQ